MQVADVNALAIPGDVTGAVDPADDLDIFTVQLSAGDTWQWQLEAADGGLLAGHLAIAEHANKVPNLVGRAAAGGAVTQEQFALSSGRYNVFVRDVRNVTAPSQHLGGPAYDYRLTVTKQVKTPAPLTLPANLTATLPSRTAQALYSFTTTTSSMVVISVKAQNKAPASDLDGRLSLFDANAKLWLKTNDDQVLGSNADPLIQGTLPAGTYVIVLDNVSPAASDLSYELHVTSS